MNEYERIRLENIAKNEALLKEIGLQGKSLLPPPSKKTHTPVKRKPPVKREVADITPRRTSARLSGLPAESEAARKKAEAEKEAFLEAERAKRRRVEGPIELVDVIQDGDTWEDAKTVLAAVTRTPVARQYRERPEDPNDTARLKSTRKEMAGLSLHTRHHVNDVRITPERIYCVGMHPGVDKKLCVAGDKVGYLGMWDVDAVEGEDGDEDDEDEQATEPKIHHFKLHARTITALTFDPMHGNKLFTSSYDCSVRCLDLTTGRATEVHANDDDAAYTSVEVLPDGNAIYMSDLDGNVTCKDLRSRDCLQLHRLHERKVGSVSLHPHAPHIVCTASLDRTMKVWDWRMISRRRDAIPPLATYEGRLSISSAYYNTLGSVVTTSFDDTLCVFDGVVGEPEADTLEPDHIVGHNNHTGRFLTVFKAHWQSDPADGVQKFCCGNMKRKIDLFDAQGNALVQLDNEQITAVPAVVEYHPSQNWVVAGNASGKCLLWS